MKAIHCLCLVLAMFLCSGLNAGNTELTAEIQHVTVFYQGAQIQRITSRVSLPAGQSFLVVKGLEKSLDENSLRAGIQGEGKILSVVRTTDFLFMKQSTEEINTLKERLDELNKQAEEEMLERRVFEQEKQLLISNSKLGGTQNGVTVSQIKEAADYYRSRLKEIESMLLRGERQIKEIEEEKKRINRQLSELNYKKNQPTSTLTIQVEMGSAGSCRLQFDYYVPNASWQPQYDLRIDEIGDPVNLIRKASVRQSTGEDWTDVGMTFSTGNPNEQQLLPVLRPWYLDIIQPIMNRALQGKVPGVNVRSAAKSQPQAQQELEEVVYAEAADVEFDYSPAPATRSGKNSILEFSLDSKGTIPSDNNEYNFSLGEEALNASYHYQVVPKLDRSAYLVATIRDWEGYELVDGIANLYYERTFIGETYLSTTMLLDSLQMSLGKDRGLVIERRAVKEYTRTRSIGQNTKKDMAYEIQIRNTKSRTVQLIVEDQVPVSSNSQITVNTEDIGDAEMDDSTGKVTWRISIDPNESVELPLRYSIRYPKEVNVGL